VSRDTPKDTPAHSRRLDRSLVRDASAVGARPAEMVAVEVRQVVVVVFGKLDEATMPEAAPAASADASLSRDHRSRQDVIAGVAELPIGATAGLFASGIGDTIGVLAVQTRDGVAATSVREGDFLKALLGEPKASSLASVGDGALVRYSHGVNLLSRLAGSRGVQPPAGPFPFQHPHYKGVVNLMQWFYNLFIREKQKGGS
jgi:hypothetical protein